MQPLGPHTGPKPVPPVIPAAPKGPAAALLPLPLLPFFPLPAAAGNGVSTTPLYVGSTIDVKNAFTMNGNDNFCFRFLPMRTASPPRMRHTSSTTLLLLLLLLLLGLLLLLPQTPLLTGDDPCPRTDAASTMLLQPVATVTSATKHTHARRVDRSIGLSVGGGARAWGVGDDVCVCVVCGV